MTNVFDIPPTAGTRDDPHTQARTARGQPLLLHSMALFREVFQLLFAARKISTVVEVGVESGQVSSLYAELGASMVYCVDPAPTSELRSAFAGHDELRLVVGHSPEMLAELPIADMYVLDGDHNYATVRAEVDWIVTHAPDALIVFHDVLWPCSRRDLYYEPKHVPAGQRNRSTADGPSVWHDEVTPAGFIGHGAFTMAQRAGGDGNGVLTAIEDAVASCTTNWHFEVVPAVFGLGVLLRPRSVSDMDLVDELRRYSRSELIATMENNRIGLYTWVLQLQYEAAEHVEHSDRLASTVASQQDEIDRLRHELAACCDRGVAQEEQLRAENDDLARQLERHHRPAMAVRRLISTVTARMPRATERNSGH